MQNTVNAKTPSNPVTTWRLIIVLAFALVFLQTSSLLHSHDGDLTRHTNCHFCLKIGTGDDASFVTSLTFTAEFSTTRIDSIAFVAIVTTITMARSRSPPSNTLS